MYAGLKTSIAKKLQKCMKWNVWMKYVSYKALRGGLGVCGNTQPSSQRLIAYIFHPSEPFIISIQKTNISFHFRNIKKNSISEVSSGSCWPSLKTEACDLWSLGNTFFSQLQGSSLGSLQLTPPLTLSLGRHCQ